MSVVQETTATKRLGVKLKQHREARGLTQEALATKAGVNRVYVAQIETSVKVPSIHTLEKLAKALGVKVGRLLE